MTTGDQVAGQIDGSVDFDGGDDWVDVGDKSSLNAFGQDYTIGLWINLDSYDSSYTTSMVGRFSGSAGYEFGISGDVQADTGVIFLKHWSGSSVRETSNSVVSLDSWHYITMTYDVSETEVHN